MTALCGGGPSQVRSPFGNIVTIGADAITAFVETYVGGDMANFIGAAIGSLSIDAPTFCSVDPPADPNLTQNDIADALDYANPLTFGPALDRLRQWFQHTYWCQLCQCSSGTTPACGPPSNPGSVTVNPGIPGSANPTCWQQTYTNTNTPPVPQGILDQDLTQRLLPIGTGPGVPVNLTGIESNATGVAWPISPTVTSFDLVGDYISGWPSGRASDSSGAYWFTYNASTGLVTSDITAIVQGVATVPHRSFSPVRGQGLWPTADTHYGITFHGRNFTGAPAEAIVSTISAVGHCNGPPLQQECCPPDPSIIQKLNQLYGLMNQIFISLPSPLTSYAVANQHGGLTGNGTLTLVASKPLAIRVDITTDASSLGVDPGSPPFLFDRGYIVPVVNTAPIRGETRLTYNPQMYLLPELTDSIGYSLHPGIVATISELTRGP